MREAGLNEIHRLIREEEPPRPSTRLSSLGNEDSAAIAKAHSVAFEKLNRMVRGDLDWIVMKSLEKDRNRRYESATEFAADIENYLNDQPVLARPPSASYQLGKFARRNKAALITAALLFTVMLVGMVVSTWQAVLAAQSAAESKAVMEFFETRVLAAARPKEQVRGLGIDATIREAIDAAEPQIGEAFVDQPLIEASIRESLGKTYHYMGEHKIALAQHERTLALRKKVLGSEHPDTLESMRNLAVSYRFVGRYEEALALHESVLILRKKVLGPTHLSTLHSMAGLAVSYGDAGRHEEALALKNEVLDMKIKLIGAKHENTLESMHNLAYAYQKAGRHEEELVLYERTLDLRKEVLGSEHPSTLITMNSLAQSYWVAGRHEEAAKQWLDLIALEKREKSRELTSAIKGLVKLYQDSGKPDKAKEWQTKLDALNMAK